MYYRTYNVEPVKNIGLWMFFYYTIKLLFLCCYCTPLIFIYDIIRLARHDISKSLYINVLLNIYIYIYTYFFLLYERLVTVNFQNSDVILVLRNYLQFSMYILSYKSNIFHSLFPNQHTTFLLLFYK